MLEAERKAKQGFLREEVVEAGYSPQLFVAYCETQRGADVDLWSFDELHLCVAEFKKLYKPGDLPITEPLDADEIMAESQPSQEQKDSAEAQAKKIEEDKTTEAAVTEAKDTETIRLADMASKSAYVYTVPGTVPRKSDLAGSIEIFVTE